MLDFAEVRAEKVRAAITRRPRAIRDFYDLNLIAAREIDMSSDEFVNLVDRKLAELSAKPLSEQPASFGLSASEVEALEAGQALLQSVLRVDEGPFAIKPVLEQYNKLWGKEPN